MYFGKTAKRTDPDLWEDIVEEVKEGSKGGKPGQWSARKAQLAVKMYKDEGGGYIGRKSKNNSLTKWTKEDWGTKSGRYSVQGKNPSGERYLPKKARKSLTKKQYRQTSRKKRASMKKGKQYSKQPKKIANITRKYRSSSKRKSKKSRKSRKSKTKIPIDKKGSLTKHGYSSKDLAKVRRKALTKAINSLMRTKRLTRREAAVKVIRRLTAIRNLNSRNKRLSDTFRRDANWVSKKYVK